jgi:hypothetical protein
MTRIYFRELPTGDRIEKMLVIRMGERDALYRNKRVF